MTDEEIVNTPQAIQWERNSPIATDGSGSPTYSSVEHIKASMIQAVCALSARGTPKRQVHKLILILCSQAAKKQSFLLSFRLTVPLMSPATETVRSSCCVRIE
jgi:hypothetical protein